MAQIWDDILEGSDIDSPSINEKCKLMGANSLQTNNGIVCLLGWLVCVCAHCPIECKLRIASETMRMMAVCSGEGEGVLLNKTIETIVRWI